MSAIKVLIVDDEADILDLLEYNLQQNNFEVYKAANGTEAIEIAKKVNPKVIILDVMMPKMDGIETCRRLREMPEFRQTHILFLTARTEEYSELAGFDAGADDYVQKPIKPRILISRINAILRRDTEVDTEKPKVIKIKDIEINRETFLVTKDDGTTIVLAKKEFELLYFLASKPGKVFSRNILLENVWGTDVLVVDRTVDVHIRKLREKIGEEYISTVKGVGYKFEP
ncbi:MAG: response regulator transcription factor [Bacteroidia bacterium]|nr:response regulator transcription factor [Bacteroidia bacterium]MDW8347303.1 response regulator transcription factor [Bacteroidia bacterium]